MKKIPFNPYIVGNPIKTREMFFGREDDFQYVIRKLGDGRSNQILIFCGDRRSGKTSILFQILLGRLGEEFLPILIDMQILAGIKSDSDFFKAIIEVACTQLNITGFTLKSLEEKNEDPSIEGLYKLFISEIEKKFPDKILLFLLDEYELIETKIRDGSLSENIIHFLSGILESTHKISFIFTGSTNLENRKVEYWKTLLGKSIYRKISYLSPNDTARLITEPLKKYINFPKDVVTSIYRLTGGQPFYTQVICQNIVDLLMEEERDDPNREDLKVISKDIVNNPLPQMIYSWNNLKDYVRLVLSALSGVIKGSEKWAGTHDVFGYLKKNKIKLPFKKEQINILLEEAYHKEFLEKNDQGLYRFRMDIFRQWTKKEHSIWKVVKEIRLELKKTINPLFVVLPSGIIVITIIVLLALNFITMNNNLVKNPEPSIEITTEPTASTEISIAPTSIPEKPEETMKKTLKPTSSPKPPEIKGMIIISSDPPKAGILLDGEDTGKTTPASFINVKEGDYTFEIILEGYKREAFTITINNEEPVEKEVILTKSLGSLVLKIRPTAIVYFKNPDKMIKEEGTTHPIETPRIKPLNVQTGIHTLTVKNESMRFERTINIEIIEGIKTIIDWDIANEKNPIITKE